MAKSDFTFVGQPHDPRSISGSDPYNGITVSGQDKALDISLSGNARLAFWYKFDPGCVSTRGYYWETHERVVTGSFEFHRSGAIEVIWDVSGNSKSFTYTGKAWDQGSDRISTRHLYPLANEYQRIGRLSSSFDAGIPNSNHRIHGDDQNFMMGDSRYHGDRTIAYYSGLGPTSGDRYGENMDGYSTWVSGNITQDGADSTTTKCFPGGRSTFMTMTYKADEGGQGAHHQDDRTYPLLCTYPATYPHQLYSSEHDTFAVGLVHDGGSDYRTTTFFYREKDNSDTVETRGTTTDLATGWHVLSMTYDNQTNPAEQVTASMYLAGEQQAQVKKSATDNTAPKNDSSYMGVKIGASPSAGGGDIDSNDMTDDYINGVHEYFGFDDSLSHVRRQQMEMYLADRLDMVMSSSTYLPQFDGGKIGLAYAHSLLSNPLSGESQGTGCRRYKMENTGSGVVGPVKLNEVGGGAFVKSSVDGGAYYKMKSTEAVQMTMWVRAEETDDARHAGSQVALVAKATSPFGHQMDNIKGYALKFGTFKDGNDMGDTPAIRLSMRNADEWLDGTTLESSGDKDLSWSGVTIARDKWYQLKLEVIPAGHNYDKIRCYAREPGGSYAELGSSPYYVYNDAANYRHWWDDNLDETQRVRVPNGTHNGYWVALSSSTGQRLDTSYYVDEFTIKTDTVL